MSQKTTFDDLKKRTDPPFNAWGLQGPNEELGRLNLICPDSVKRGRDAIKQGVRVNLNLPLEWNMNPNRGCVDHQIISEGYYQDDRISMNTQASSQWDGFLHVPYQNYPEKGKYLYFGHTLPETAGDISVGKFGIHNFAKYPISSRAHLLDIVEWRASKGLPPHECLSNKDPVTLEELKECAKDEGVEFAPGDVLIVRSGFTEAWMAMSDEEKKAYDPMHGAIGVDPTEECMRWHWDNGIAAVAGDAFAYEFWPPNFARGPAIHEVFLAGWGLPLGELWDLRELSVQCKKYKQYTFLLTSMTLNKFGGIGSPSNAQAIL